MVPFVLQAADTLPLPSNWTDALLGSLGLTVYLLYDRWESRKERRDDDEAWRTKEAAWTAERNTLEAEAREMTKRALAALDALARKESS